VIGPLQFIQGLLPVLLARYVGNVTGAGLVVVGILAVVGNGWSLFLHFDGGRGVAVSTGAVAGLQPESPWPCSSSASRPVPSEVGSLRG